MAVGGDSRGVLVGIVDSEEEGIMTKKEILKRIFSQPLKAISFLPIIFLVGLWTVFSDNEPPNWLYKMMNWLGS